ncbi:MAG: nucleotide exchange factor GrpE [Oscillospiraceae bacterium]|nr:nucleotide exchange factor GrpE [Oscillospiraceae bacterium]
MNEEKEEKKETAPQTEAPETAAADGAPKAETPAEKKPEKKDKRSAKKKDEERIAALETEKAALNDKFLRICAEYDNFRRRSQREREALYGDIRADVVQKFLPVYDDLERALKQGTEDEAYRRGVEMIMSKFVKTLDALGVKKIESLGQTFDPKLHNAVMHVDDESQGENVIVDVFQEGFMLGDKVIRFAMVKVAN